MQQEFQQALDNTLESPKNTSGKSFTINIVNNTALELNVIYVGQSAVHNFEGTVAAGKTFVDDSSYDGAYYLFSTTATGAYLGVTQAETDIDTYTIDATLLTSANDIGKIPSPTRSVPIPVNSASVLVGYGTLTNGNIVTREQNWTAQGDSYCLAPGEHRTVSYTDTYGTQQSTSSTESMSTSVGTSVSAGWGPISASISASISTSSTTTQQATMTEEHETYVSTELWNNGTSSLLLLRWQLTEVTNILDKSKGTVLSSIQRITPPSLVRAYSFGPSTESGEVNELSGEALLKMTRPRLA